ncbi:YueI family protein [Bacillus sp. CGMCC 1.16541]|uniref:YueI family protein n=1 Tax=Bacillus sp. CGMCC 1.16541 TaxID=2185143 RepID=UPI000D737B68|nr:YueI family protein [Bacillus sp. CGMCC 1.16541]
MERNNIDEYLERGIHGAKETKPDERRYYLTTLRERIEIALKKGQVMKAQPYEQVVSKIKNVQDGQLFLNGTISYSHLSKYIQVANAHNVPFTIVQNLEADTDIGLVLTGSQGSEDIDIFIED